MNWKLQNLFSGKRLIILMFNYQAFWKDIEKLVHPSSLKNSLRPVIDRLGAKYAAKTLISWHVVCQSFLFNVCFSLFWSLSSFCCGLLQDDKKRRY